MAKISTSAKTAIATAVSLVVMATSSEAAQRSSFRLALEGEISSRPDQPSTPPSSGRLEVSTLIQSHPDPLFAELEDRYQALPPFTQAREEIPEQYIVEAGTRERIMDGVRDFASNVSTFVPNIRTQVREDDIRERARPDADGNQRELDYTTLLATVNPTFRYQTDRRKWHLRATYDYETGQYYHDRDSDINDHIIDVDWVRRLSRGNEFRVNALAEDTHDRITEDPIRDFDSQLEAQDLDYKRYLVNLLYRNGTLRDRTRYDIYYYNEYSDLEADELLAGGYTLNRQAVGGTYEWQLRRQISLVAEAKYQDFDYDLSFRDNYQYKGMVGTDMIVGRRLRAKLRVGYEEKTFDKSVLDDSFGDVVWDGMVEWAVRRKSSVKFETGRDIYELTTANSFIDASKFNIQSWARSAWEERWSDKLTTTASYTYRETEFKGRENGEDAEQFVLTADYQLNNRWKISLDGAYTRQETDLGGDLKRRTFTVRTDYSL